MIITPPHFLWFPELLRFLATLPVSTPHMASNDLCVLSSIDFSCIIGKHTAW